MNTPKTLSGSEIIAQMHARRAKAADLIDVCKYLPKADALAALKAAADAEHVQYPQYKGHWDHYRLCRITRRVKTKAGVAFEAGDLAMVINEADGRRLAYSNRNGIDTGVPPSYVQEVQ